MEMHENVIEQTLILIKPDGMKRSLTGNIIAMLSHPDNIIVGAKIVNVSNELAEEHYNHLKDKPFFTELVAFITGKGYTDRVMALVYEGPNIIGRIRKKAGATNPEDAESNTIRGKYGRIHSKTGIFENVIHCSENSKEAEREIKLWFKPTELVSIRFPIDTKKHKEFVIHWKNECREKIND